MKIMMLVTSQKISSVMTLFPIPQSLAGLYKPVASGLPKGALKAGVDHVYLSGEV